MTNDKNTINELVIDDDDPTAELETLSLKDPLPEINSNQSEVAAKTHGFQNIIETGSYESVSELKSELEARSETINRLQFDLEQLDYRRPGHLSKSVLRRRRGQRQRRPLRLPILRFNSSRRY